MPVNLDQCQVFAKPIALALLRAEVDRLLVDERVIEAIEDDERQPPFPEERNQQPDLPGFPR